MRKKVLIVKFGQIGDVIMAIPSARALYEQGYEIEWLCGSAVAGLLGCYSWIRVIPANDRALLMGTLAQRVKALIHIWKKIGLKQYDLCAILYYDLRYRAVTLPVIAERRISLSRASRATTLLPARHPSDEWLRILMQAEDSCRECSAAPVRPDLLPAPARSKQSSRRIALVPGGAQHLIREQASGRMPEQALRNWPIESYVELAQMLRQHGAEVILLGAKEDAWVLPHFSGMAVTSLIGTLSLPEVISACDECDVVVSHDTGPLHLAGLSRASVVGIFGPTDPSTRVPRRAGVVGIWGGHNFACRPCYDGRDFAACRYNGCIRQVTPGLVLSEVDRLVEQGRRELSSAWRVLSTAEPTRAG